MASLPLDLRHITPDLPRRALHVILLAGQPPHGKAFAGLFLSCSRSFHRGWSSGSDVALGTAPPRKPNVEKGLFPDSAGPGCPRLGLRRSAVSRPRTRRWAKRPRCQQESPLGSRPPAVRRMDGLDSGGKVPPSQRAQLSIRGSDLLGRPAKKRWDRVSPSYVRRRVRTRPACCRKKGSVPLCPRVISLH